MAHKISQKIFPNVAWIVHLVLDFAIFAPGEQLERALKNTRVVTGAADLIMQAIRQKKERLS